MHTYLECVIGLAWFRALRGDVEIGVLAIPHENEAFAGSLVAVIFVHH